MSVFAIVNAWCIQYKQKTSLNSTIKDFHVQLCQKQYKQYSNAISKAMQQSITILLIATAVGISIFMTKNETMPLDRFADNYFSFNSCCLNPAGWGTSVSSNHGEESLISILSGRIHRKFSKDKVDMWKVLLEFSHRLLRVATAWPCSDFAPCLDIISTELSTCSWTKKRRNQFELKSCGTISFTNNGDKTRKKFCCSLRFVKAVFVGITFHRDN